MTEDTKMLKEILDYLDIELYRYDDTRYYLIGGEERHNGEPSHGFWNFLFKDYDGLYANIEDAAIKMTEELWQVYEDNDLKGHGIPEPDATCFDDFVEMYDGRWKWKDCDTDYIRETYAGYKWEISALRFLLKDSNELDINLDDIALAPRVREYEMKFEFEIAVSRAYGESPESAIEGINTGEIQNITFKGESRYMGECYAYTGRLVKNIRVPVGIAEQLFADECNDIDFGDFHEKKGLYCWTMDVYEYDKRAKEMEEFEDYG